MKIINETSHVSGAQIFDIQFFVVSSYWLNCESTLLCYTQTHMLNITVFNSFLLFALHINWAVMTVSGLRVYCVTEYGTIFFCYSLSRSLFYFDIKIHLRRLVTSRNWYSVVSDADADDSCAKLWQAGMERAEAGGHWICIERWKCKEWKMKNYKARNCRRWRDRHWAKCNLFLFFFIL